MKKPAAAAVRLQKFLAEAGLASRRKAEEIIQSGRVRVNGKVVTELGTKVDPGRDLVVVDGAPVERKTSRRYILLYKPPGCVTTLSDPQGRPTARGYLTGVKERVFPVGRLDYDAEGALLFTDDGELANRLAHPSFGHRRVYLVKTKGDPDPGALRRLCEGVRLEDGPAKALVAEVHEKAEKNTWVKIVVGEGRNHFVKRLCEAVGLPVLRLFRPEFGGVTVARLRSGHWRDLTDEEVEGMRAATRGAATDEKARLPLPLDLPKAARRHGHGPPSQGSVDDQQPADRARDDRRADELAELRGWDERKKPQAGRGGRDTRDTRGGRDTRDTRGGRDARDTRGGRDTRDTRGGRDARDTRGGRDARDTRDTRDARDTRGGRDTRDAPGGRGARDARGGPPKRGPAGERPAQGGRPASAQGRSPDDRSGSRGRPGGGRPSGRRPGR
jgi:23S rRNA pseudouridine2605 synthase